MQGRLREQAERAARWLEDGDRRGIVQPAVQPFLSPSLSARLFQPPATWLAQQRRQAYTLENEGAALLELSLIHI